MNQEFTSNNTTQETYDASMPTAAPGFIRLANHLLDSLLLTLVVVALVSSFEPAMLPKSLEEAASGPFMSIMYVLQFVYYLVAEFFFGKTLGKVLTRTYVTTEYNEKPGFSAILIRTLCRYIPFEYLTFLGSGIGWHDKFSKTYVVRAPKA